MSELGLSLLELHALAARILIAHDTSATNAECVARAIVLAEADGQVGHGASRLPSYAAQAKSGKVNGHATPVAELVRPAGVRIDARAGFAYPALQLAIEHVCELAPRLGIAAAAVANSHHSGVAGHHVEAVANKGLIGLFFSNGPVAIAPWGGSKGVFSTNPLAFAAPRKGHDPLVIDMSLSKVARGKINVAAQRGEAIPEGWALDASGKPTTDAASALEGTMLPMGDAKGAQLVLMIEILAAALTASHFGYEADSFFTGAGDQPLVGHTLLAIEPNAFSQNQFAERLEALLTTILSQQGTRLPGARRYYNRRQAEAKGIIISPPLSEQLRTLDSVE